MEALFLKQQPSKMDEVVAPDALHQGTTLVGPLRSIKDLGFRACVRTHHFTDLVPEGRLKVAQDAVLGTMHITTKSPARDG